MSNAVAKPRPRLGLAPTADLLMALGHLTRAIRGMDRPFRLDEAAALDDAKWAIEYTKSAMKVLEQKEREK